MYLEDFRVPNDDGSEVYFTTATYRSDAELTTYSGRKQTNVLGSRALVCDLDFLKHNRDLAWAVGLLDATCATYNLPSCTTVVDTGGGLHCYWLLDEVLAQDRWAVLAQRLGAVFALVNASIGARVIDTQCTVDICRVLRVPGFRNNKYPHRPLVRVIRQGGEVLSVAAMLAGLPLFDLPSEGAAATDAAFAAALPASALAATVPSGRTSAFARVNAAGPPASWDGLLRKTINGGGCGVLLTALMDSAAVTYAEWAGLLSVIQYTDGGDKALTTLMAASRCHTNWGDTQNISLVRAKAATFAGPMTCAKFAQGMPSVCAACPHSGRIKSPIVLGRDTPRGAGLPVPEAAPPDVVVVPDLTDTQEPPEPDSGVTLPPVDAMFRYAPNTGEVLMRMRSTEPGAPEFHVISNRPIWLRYSRYEVQRGRSEIILGLAILDRKGKEHLREVYAASVATVGMELQGVFAWATMHGMHPRFTNVAGNSTAHPMSMFLKSLLASHGATRSVRLAEHFGPSREYQPTDFLLGATRYDLDTQSAVDAPVPSASPLAPYIAGMCRLPDAEALAEAGAFKAHVAAVYAGPDMRVDRFMIASGLATTLTPFLVPQDSQGGVIAMASEQSGTGKSGTMNTIASMFTRNTRALRMQSATKVAVFKTQAPLLTSLPLILDDWDKLQGGYTKDEMAKAMAELIVTSTTLQPKKLGNGEVTPGFWTTWIYMASNAEILGDVMRQTHGDEATGMRFLALEVPPDRINDVAKQARFAQFQTWREAHGAQVGHLWLKSVMTHPAMSFLRGRYDFWLDRFMRAGAGMADSRARYLRAMVVCSTVAAEAAKALNLLELDPEDVFATGVAAAQIHLADTGKAIVDQSAFLEDYLVANARDITLATVAQRGLQVGSTVAAVVGDDDRVMIPLRMLQHYAQKIGISTSRMRARVLNQYPGAQYGEVHKIPVGPVFVLVRCVVVKMPGMSERVMANLPAHVKAAVATPHVH